MHNLPGGSNSNHKKKQSKASQCPGQDPNKALPNKSHECYLLTNLFGGPLILEKIKCLPKVTNNLDAIHFVEKMKKI
jgi:hypothetical protein